MFFFAVLLLGCRYDGGKENTKARSYKGIITDIYKEKKWHYMYAFKINVNNDTVKKPAEFWPRSWEYTEIGDSIIKPKDTLMIIIKKNDSISKEFFYEF